MIVSLCPNIKSSQITGYDSIDGVIKKIRTGETQVYTNHARKYGKHSLEYEKIKYQVPTFTPNASFSHKRELSQLKDPSGFIYLDIDEFSDIDYLKNDNHIYSCWKSFSGTGIGALVQVPGITIQNFKQTWRGISEYYSSMGIQIDRQTCDITRQNVISYDPNIHVNKDSIAFDIVSILDQNTKEVNYFDHTPGNMSITTLFDGFEPNYNDLTGIKYSTTLPDYMGLDYVVIEEGKEYRSGFLPKEIRDGSRHRWMVGYTISILFNNSTITKERLYSNVLYANKTHCVPPLPMHEIMSIVNWYHDKHIKGNLDYHPRIKKIWFDPGVKIDKNEKKRIGAIESGKLRRAKALITLKSIYKELLSQTGRVTQKMLAEKSKCSIGKIKNYWSEITT
jgi:hypothetical protein